MQKGKLIEKLAELVLTRKVPILGDVRDESAEDVRIVLEPKSRNVDPDVLMGTLYRMSELETRFALNMNVLIDGVTPRVCGLRDVLQAFLDHRRDVLLRRSAFRIGELTIGSKCSKASSSPTSTWTGSSTSSATTTRRRRR